MSSELRSSELPADHSAKPAAAPHSTPQTAVGTPAAARARLVPSPAATAG